MIIITETKDKKLVNNLIKKLGFYPDYGHPEHFVYTDENRSHWYLSVQGSFYIFSYPGFVNRNAVIKHTAKNISELVAIVKEYCSELNYKISNLGM